MKQVVLSRISLALCFLGMFISGVLSMQHLFDFKIPCGMSSGCERVKAMSISSIGPIPIAVLGFAMYLTLALMLIWRASADQATSARLLKIGWGFTAIGAICSIALQVYSFAALEICPWCLSHAATITVIFVLLGILVQSAPAVEKPPVVDEGVPARPRLRMADLAVFGVFFVAMVGGLWYEAATMKHSGTLNIDPKLFGENPLAALVPKDAHVQGPENARLTIVEFADLGCGTCAEMYPLIDKIVKDHPTTVRYVFRHFPLYMRHKLSTSAAILSEFAADHGKFWEFVERAYSTDPEQVKEVQFYITILESMGLDAKAAEKALEDQNSPAWNRMYADLQEADRLGLQSTPTFFLSIDGKAPEAVAGMAVLDRLKSEPYASIISGNGAK